MAERKVRSESKPKELIKPAERGAILGGFIDWALDTMLAFKEGRDAIAERSVGKKTVVENPFSLEFITNGVSVIIRNDLMPGSTQIVAHTLELYLRPVGSTENTGDWLDISAHTEYSALMSPSGKRTYLDGGARTWKGRNLDVDLLASAKVSKDDVEGTLDELKKSVLEKLGIKPSGEDNFNIMGWTNPEHFETP